MKTIESLEKLFNSIKGVLQLIDSRVRLWGAIILFVSSILILLIFSDKIPFNEWYIYLFFIVIIVIALGIVLDLILPDHSKSYKQLLKTGSQISGTWGEFMHNHDYIALSIIKIKFNAHLLQFIFEGEAYNHEGEKVADWNSSASAVSRFSPPEIYYFWEGTNYKPIINSKSGMGVLNFAMEGNDQLQEKAYGWYTSEDISNLEINKKYRVEVIRMTADEQEKLKLPKDERRKFIAATVQKWKK